MTMRDAFAAATIARRARLVAAVSLALAAPSVLSGRVPVAVFMAVAAVATILALVAGRRCGDLPSLRVPWRHPLTIALLAMAAAWLVPALVTLDPPYSPRLYAQTMGLFLLGAGAVAALSGDRRALSVALRVLVIAATAAAAAGCIAIFLWPDLLSALRLRPVAGADDAAATLKAYGSLMPCLAALVIWAGFRTGGWWRWLALAFVALGAALVWGVDSKSALAGYAGALLLLGLCILAARLPRPAALALVAAVLIMAGAGSALIVSRLPVPPYAGQQQLRLPTSLVDAHRQVIWGFTVHRAMDRPVFGWGLGTAGRTPGSKTVIPEFNQEYIPSHTHNWVLQLLLESGLVGLLAALAALAALLGTVVGMARRGWGGGWAATGLTGAYAISGLSNFSVWSAWWQASLIALLVLAMARPAHAQTPRGG